MAKWFGKIGYAVPTKEVQPGIYRPQIIEKEYYGDITSDKRRRVTSDEVNDTLSLNNVLSIISDPFAIENCSYIAYAKIHGCVWKVTEVEVQYPRLVLTIGGVYNGEQA